MFIYLSNPSDYFFTLAGFYGAPASHSIAQNASKQRSRTREAQQCSSQITGRGSCEPGADAAGWD
jgi:hypothetical protein